MNGAKRRINSTGRRRINREHIRIRLLPIELGVPLRAEAELSIDSYKFPNESKVSIEAYHRSSGMRFDCGTIGSLRIPNPLILSEVDTDGSILFRVKVADHVAEKGKLLGLADGLHPSGEEGPDGRQSLFPVIYRDLGEEAWRVDIGISSRPKLVLNSRIPSIAHRLQSDRAIQAFLLPAALRIVLAELLRQSEIEDDEEPGWASEWMEYCRDNLGMKSPISGLDDEGKRYWIDDALKAFCGSRKFVEALKSAEGGAE